MPRRNGQGSRQARRMAAERGRGERRLSAGKNVGGRRGRRERRLSAGKNVGEARARAKEPANAQNLFQNLYKNNKKFFIKRLTSKKSGGIILAEIERECQHL